jgi:hypothetical protein
MIDRVEELDLLKLSGVALAPHGMDLNDSGQL